MKKLLALIILLLTYSVMQSGYSYSISEIAAWELDSSNMHILFNRLGPDCQWGVYLVDEMRVLRSKSDPACEPYSTEDLEAELINYKAEQTELENKRLEVIAAKIDLTNRFRALRKHDMGRINRLRVKAGLAVVGNPDYFYNYDNRKGIKSLKHKDIPIVTGKIEQLEAQLSSVVAEDAAVETVKINKKNKRKAMKLKDYRKATKAEIAELLNELKEML